MTHVNDDPFYNNDPFYRYVASLPKPADQSKSIDEQYLTYLESLPDPVEKPSHYNFGKIEAIDYMKDSMTPEGFEGYLEGAVKKYLHRFKYKHKPLEDLKKAQWYLNRLIKELEEYE